MSNDLGQMKVSLDEERTKSAGLESTNQRLKADLDRRIEDAAVMQDAIIKQTLQDVRMHHERGFGKT